MRAQDVGLARPTIFVCHEKSVKNLSQTDTKLSQSPPKKLLNRLCHETLPEATCKAVTLVNPLRHLVNSMAYTVRRVRHDLKSGHIIEL